MLCFGCKTPQPHRLSAPQVVKTAQQVGIQHGQDLQGYKAPEVLFDARDKTWYVSFSPKKAYRDRDPWRSGFGVDIRGFIEQKLTTEMRGTETEQGNFARLARFAVVAPLSIGQCACDPWGLVMQSRWDEIWF